MFNIKDDPYELHNVFDENSELGIEMAEAIKSLGLFQYIKIDFLIYQNQFLKN